MTKKKNTTELVLGVAIAVLAMQGCSEPDAQIPTNIYEEDGWNTSSIEVRVAALRRDIDVEIARLEALPGGEREPTSQRLLEMMSSLRAEWGKIDGGSEKYARLEAEVEKLLEG